MSEACGFRRVGRRPGCCVSGVAIGVVGTSVKMRAERCRRTRRGSEWSDKEFGCGEQLDSVASGSFQSLAYDVSLKGTAENINGSKTAICSISASL